MYTFDLETDIMDDILRQPKSNEEPALQTHRHGRIPIYKVWQEKKETPNDKQFKFNPSMRING